jgi:uncharacterized protein involved in outer membrane biogenesis
LKWGGGLVGGLAVLILAAALVLPRLFTSEQLKGYVIPPLEDATGRQVEIDAIRLRVLPTPAVRVTGFRLANAEGYGSAPAVEARALTVDVALWPLVLLNIRPTAVALEAPVVRYEVGEDGATNFDDLGAADTTAATSEESPLAGIPVSDFRVSEARLQYTDRSTGQAFDIDFDARLDALPDGPALTSAGTVDLRSVRALLPSVGPDTLVVQDAQANYDVRVAPADGRLDLRRLQLDTAPLAVSVDGTVSGLNTQPTVDLAFETGRTDLAEMAGFAPAAAVEGVNPRGTLSLSGTISGPLADTTGTNQLTLAATGQLAEAGVDYEGSALLRDLSADLSLGLDSVALRSVEGRLLGASLAGEVSASALTSDPRLAFQLETGAMNLADLAAFAPPEQVGAYNPRGTLRLDVAADGPLPTDAASAQQLSVTGTGQLSGGGVDYDGQPLLRDLQAGLGVSGTAASMQNLDGRLLGEPVSGSIRVRDLFGAPQVEGQLTGEADLARLAALSGDDAPVESVAGRADYDVRFEGPLDTPDAIQPQGQVALADVQVPYESFRAPVQIPRATVQLTGTGLSMEEATIRSGEQSVNLRATVRSLFPIAEGLAAADPSMTASFTLTADRLDLVALYPEADTSDVYYSQLFAAHLSGGEIGGQSPDAVAEELYGGVELPAYAVDGRIEIGTLLNEPQRYDDFATDVRLEDRRLRLQNLTATTYDGTLTGSLTLDQRGASAASAALDSGSVWLATAASGRAPSSAAPASTLTYDVELRDAQAGAVLDDWTTLGRLVTGTLTLDADGETALTDGLLPETNAFTAVGQSLVANGGLSLDVGPAQALVNALNLPAPSLKQFQRLGGPFAIEDGQFRLETWTFGGRQFDGTLQGALGLGGGVDLELTLQLPLSVLSDSGLPARLGGSDSQLGPLLSKLAGGKAGTETVPVTVRLGGTMRDPSVEVLNRDAITSRIQALAKEQGLNRLRKLFGGGGG